MSLFKTKNWLVQIPKDCEASYDRHGLLIVRKSAREFHILIKFLHKAVGETTLADLRAYSKGVFDEKHLESYSINKWKGFLRKDGKIFLRNGPHFLIIERAGDYNDDFRSIIENLKKNKKDGSK